MAEEMRADYCIAGAGIAGVLLASRLAASGKTVLMLEQGPRYSEDDRLNLLFDAKDSLNDFADFNDNPDPASVTPHTSAAQGGQAVEWAAMRLFGVGGTALHFEGLMIRPREDDFQMKTLYGLGRDWPITYAKLEPWLLDAENEVGVSANEDNPYASSRSGPFPMPAHQFSYYDTEILGPALKKLGVTGHSCPRATPSKPFRGRSECLACRICKFCPSGARYSPENVHVPALDESPNVTIVENVSLRRLETNSRGDGIDAAHAIRTNDRTELVIRADRFILAMGGVETPRLLMLSADDGAHKDGLGNAGGQLGKHFSDHLGPYVTFDLGRHAGVRLGFETMITEHFRAQGDRDKQPGYVIFSSPAMDWFPVGNEATDWAIHDDVLSMDEVRATIPRMATLSTMTETEGQGVIELDETTTDAFGAPVAKVTANLSKWDRAGNDALKRLAPQLAEAMGAKEASEVAPPEFGMGYHPSGTTAMAKTPDEGVCDTDLKVFGLNNLFLVSNSVFPHMGPNPPTLTIAALALRLADHLEGRASR